MTNDMATLQKSILDDYRRLGSWSKVGQAWGINKGLAYQIAANGHEPINPAIREKLHLPEVVMVVACTRCGKVHRFVKHCNRPAQPRIVTRWRDLPTGLLLHALQNREVVCLDR